MKKSSSKTSFRRIVDMAYASQLPSAAIDIQAIAVLGRAQGEETGQLGRHQGVIDCATELATAHYLLAPVAIPGHDGSYDDSGQRVPTGYLGYQAWRTMLVSLGVSSSRITPFIVRPSHEKITHTREETDGLVLLAQQQNWQNIILIAFPHQLPRVLASLLMSCRVLGVNINAYPWVPRPIDWDTLSHGSRGLTALPLHQQVYEEKERCNNYPNKGWIVPLPEVERYLADLSC